MRTLTMVIAGLALALIGGTVHAQFKKPFLPPPPSVPKTPSGKMSPTPPPKDLPVLQSLTLSK
ncbi:MAG: hypothetical protein JRI68_33720, partial [Deltaproteobacteria bacterium]|nr:hypothetical protein [Deltaproteobacteria bacterium]